MNGMMIFRSAEFGAIRTMSSPQGEPMFCLKDVCEALGLQTNQVVRRLMDDVFSKHPIVDNLGRSQQATFVNEDGLYDTIFESRKPQAKQFRKWVTGEVLPAIRKQGGQYMLYADYARQGFAKSRTRTHTVKDGIVLTETYLVWTERGREFIHRLLNPKFAN